MRNVVEYLNGAIESILNHHFDIASLAKEAREISKSFDYAAIRKTALEKMKSAQEKYSKGTRYTGPLGYYYPSQLRLLRTDNMRRGRLVKKDNVRQIIYEYDDQGELFCIVFPDLFLTTYRLAFQNCEAYISYKDYVHQDNPEICNTIFIKKDCDQKILFIIDIAWTLDMTWIGELDIDLYYDNATKCRLISAIERPEGGFMTYDDQNYSVVCDESLNILAYDEC